MAVPARNRYLKILLTLLAGAGLNGDERCRREQGLRQRKTEVRAAGIPECPVLSYGEALHCYWRIEVQPDHGRSAGGKGADGQRQARREARVVGDCATARHRTKLNCIQQDVLGSPATAVYDL